MIATPSVHELPVGVRRKHITLAHPLILLLLLLLLLHPYNTTCLWLHPISNIITMADTLLSASESRKSRLQILRERQQKLRESYKSQIDISRRTLNDDGEGTTAAAASLTAITESVTTPKKAEDAAATTTTSDKKSPLSVDTTSVPVTPSTPSALAVALTPSAAILSLQKENEELKRQVVAVQADRELLLQKQMERFASASEQLNEMEELLEDYRNIAEESEENNAVLKAKVSLMTTENESLKSDNEQLTAQVKKQHERLDSSVQAMNDLESDLVQTQDDLDLTDQHVRTLELQLRKMNVAVSAATPAPVFHGGQSHGGTTFYPPPPHGTTFYPLPTTTNGAANAPGAPGAPVGRPPHHFQPNNLSAAGQQSRPSYSNTNIQQPFNVDQGGDGAGQTRRNSGRSQNNKKKRR